VLLEKGQALLVGQASGVVHDYLAKFQDIEHTEWKGDEGDESIRLVHTWVRPHEEAGIFHTSAELEVGVEVRLLKPIEGLILGFRLISEYGAILLYTLFDDETEMKNVTYGPGDFKRKFYLPKDFLAEGKYTIAFSAGIHMQKSIIHMDHGNLFFAVENIRGIGRLHLGAKGQAFQSMIRPRLRIE
jgi:hypothetical protein